MTVKPLKERLVAFRSTLKSNMYYLIDADADLKENIYLGQLFNEAVLFPSKEDLQKYVFG